MRTTLNLDDAVMRRARQRAAKTGQTLTQVIEDALRQSMAQEERAADSTPTRLVAARQSGGPRPGVDLDNTADLLDRMDGMR